jgi:phage-related protein
MTRAYAAPGEKPLLWAASSKRDLIAFPAPVRRRIGRALGVAQFGGKHPAAKPCKGEGSGVFEIVEDHRGGRTVRCIR